MATWWNLEITGEPNEVDLRHIAEMVREGFTDGPLVQDEEWMVTRTLKRYRFEADYRSHDKTADLEDTIGALRGTIAELKRLAALMRDV